MRLRDANLRRALAGEYAMGTMHERARRRFETYLSRDPALRGEVEAWQASLYQLSDAVVERDPPPRAWEAIAKRVMPPAPAKTPLLERLGFWQATAAFASTVAIALALVIGLLSSQPPTQTFVAVILDSQQRVAWIAAAKSGDSTIRVRTLSEQTIADDKDFELWLLPDAGGAPRSLGLIEASGQVDRSLPPDMVALLQSAVALAVSLEPRGGSPTGLPTGPVLYQSAHPVAF